jgi:signal recognition particle subunit SRP54
MAGQDAVNVAKSFNEQLELTGCVMSKLDGDARGGAALSIRHMTGVPIKFSGIGEKITDLDIFHPDRMADRILGMGDIMTLVEQAQDKMDMDLQQKTADRMMAGIFTFNDMLDQYRQMSKMGSMQKMLNLVPGLNKMVKNFDDDKATADMKKNEAIILSMTPYERENPKVLKASRKSRIAKGAGFKVMDVNKLCNQLEQMQTLTKMMSGGGLRDMRALQNAQMRGGGLPGSSKHAGSKKQKVKKKKKKK